MTAPCASVRAKLQQKQRSDYDDLKLATLHDPRKSQAAQENWHKWEKEVSVSTI
jgi:hypothetical protein